MNASANEQKLAISEIKRHDFETAKNALEQYTKDSNNSIALNTVDSNGGLFNWFSHKVTGDELNELTTQIQDHMITLNGVDHELFDQIRQVYIALDALDSEYITAILDSIGAIKKVNDKTLDNQADIQKSVANQEKTINVLKKFKADIDKLKHITDVDRVWELIEEQNDTLNTLQYYNDELSRIIHLKDVDTLWSDNASSKEHIDSLDTLVNSIDDKIRSLNNFKDKLLKISHINDIDSMWDDIVSHKAELTETNKKLTASIDAVEAKLSGTIIQLEDTQEKVSNTLRSEMYKEKIDMRTSLEELDKRQKDSMNELVASAKQDKQSLTEEIKAVSCIQEENKKSVIQLLEETTEVLNTQKEKFTVKLRIAYMVAGGALGITIIHFILSLVGLI